MTTGHLGDDNDEPQQLQGLPHPLLLSHLPPSSSSSPPPLISRMQGMGDGMDIDLQESKCKEEADTSQHHRRRLPSTRPPLPSLSTSFSEQKERSQSPLSSTPSPISSISPTSPPSPLSSSPTSSSTLWFFPTPPPFRPFYFHQWLDVCDGEGEWLEGQVIEGQSSAIRVHYKGYKAKYDEWLFTSPHHPHSRRVAPLHSHTRPRFPLPTRPLAPLHSLLSSLPYNIDALDSADQWLPARLLSFDPSTCLCHISYDGWSSTYDEWLPIDSYRIARRGLYSRPTVVVNRVQWGDSRGTDGGSHSSHSSISSSASSSSPQPMAGRRKSDYTATLDNESRFRRLLLTSLRYQVVDQAEDGSQHPSLASTHLTHHCTDSCVYCACTHCTGHAVSLCRVQTASSALCPISCTTTANGMDWCERPV